MNMSTNNFTNRIARQAGKQGVRLPMEHQAEVDRHATGANLLKCKRNVNFSTMNVRTLNGKSKFGEITHLSEKYGIDVTCIQEHKIYHPGENMKYHNMGNGWTALLKRPATMPLYVILVCSLAPWPTGHCGISNQLVHES